MPSNDLLEYRKRQRSAAELALADMIADSERLGLYEVDREDVRVALMDARSRLSARLEAADELEQLARRQVEETSVQDDRDG